MSSQRDDRDVVRRGIVLEHLRRFPPVDDRNGNVHQNEVGLFCPRLADAFFPVQRFRDRIAEVPEDRGINDAVILVVFHKQDCLPLPVHASPHG